MIPDCNWCRAGLACKEHPNSTRPPPPPPLQQVQSEPSLPNKLPQSFHFYQPSHPVTLAKSFQDYSSGERAHIVSSHSPDASSSGNAKRKPGDSAAPNAPLPKRPCSTTDKLPPTFKAPPPADSRPLMSAAWDVWKCSTGCDSHHAPENVELERIVENDIAYQRSKPDQRFRRPPEDYIRCIYCLRDSGRWKVWRNRDGGLTRRIREHMQKYHSEEFLPKVSRTYAPTTNPGDADLKYSPESFAKCLAQWIAVDDQAMNVVESQEFRRLLILASRAPNLRDEDIPHRKMATKTIGELYNEEMARIKHELRNARGRISVTSDLWSDNILRAFMAVTAHYINSEGYLAEHLIAFRRIKGHHTGANVGRVLFSVFEEFDIVQKLGHITLDNASPNDTLMKELEEVFKERGLVTFGHTLNRIRCFPHVINLCVTTILKELPAAAQWFRDEAAAKGDTLDEEVLDYLVALESGLIAACRGSINAMRCNDLRRDGFTESIKHGNFHSLFKTQTGEIVLLPVLQLLRDSETRWSSTYNMIQRYLQLYPAVQRFSFAHPEMKIPVVSHRQFEVLQDLLSVLLVLHSAQELLSAERTPTLALALPVYENLIQALRERALEHPMLQYAIECGIRKLEAYVAKTRDTPAYAIAMAINPCLKFRWIDEHWSRTQRNQARVEVKEQMLEARQEMHRNLVALNGYMPTSAERAARAQANGYMRLLTLRDADKTARSSNRVLADHSTPPLPLVPPPTVPSEDDLLLSHMAEVDAELLRWEAFDGFDGMTMGTVNLVDFWKARRYEFPLLYQIAMNVLPVQASSVSSERAFSSSKMTCTRERSKISAENVEYLQVVKHSAHRRRVQEGNKQTLDFMAHIVGSDSDNEADGLDG